jgi:acyl carrier protein
VLEAVVATPDGPISSLLPQPGKTAASREAQLTSDISETVPTASSLQPAPPGVLETGLAEIWQGLLMVESVAADDDFFAIGGHSLLATRMIARIADRFGVELPLISVFEAPTLRGLAGRVEAALQDRPVAAAVIPRLVRRAEP